MSLLGSVDSVVGRGACFGSSLAVVSDAASALVGGGCDRRHRCRRLIWGSRTCEPGALEASSANARACPAEPVGDASIPRRLASLRVARIRRVVTFSPTVLCGDGILLHETMAAERVTEQSLHQLVCNAGIGGMGAFGSLLVGNIEQSGALGLIASAVPPAVRSSMWARAAAARKVPRRVGQAGVNSNWPPVPPAAGNVSPIVGILPSCSVLV